MKPLAFFVLVVGAWAACKTDSDCEIGEECQKGSCAKSLFISIPGKCKDPNEEWRECGEDCVPTCTHPHPVCIQDCKKHSCQCKTGYVRERTRCIPLSDCKKPGSGGPSAHSQEQKNKLGQRCDVTGDCATGFACGHGFCSPLPTTISSIIEHLGNTGDDCLVSSDCKPGFKCGKKFKCETDAPKVGQIGDPCSRDAACHSTLTCSNGICIRHTLNEFDTEKPATTPKPAAAGGTPPLSQLLAGVPLLRPSGAPVDPSDLDNSLVALFFCAEWSFPCRDFLPTLKSFYEAVHQRGERFTVIYVPKDNKAEEYERFVKQFGDWPSLPLGHPLVEQLLRTFDAHGIPDVPLISGRRVIVRDIRPEVHFGQRDDPVILLNKWKAL